MFIPADICIFEDREIIINALMSSCKQQAGIYELTLIENKGVILTFDSNNDVTNIVSTGNTIELNTNDNVIQLSNNIDSANNNELINTYILKLELNGLDQQDLTEQINNSIYGWIPSIEFMDGQTKLINTPFFQKVNEMDTQSTHTYFIEMAPRISVNNELIDIV